MREFRIPNTDAQMSTKCSHHVSPQYDTHCKDLPGPLSAHSQEFCAHYLAQNKGQLHSLFTNSLHSMRQSTTPLFMLFCTVPLPSLLRGRLSHAVSTGAFIRFYSSFKSTLALNKRLTQPSFTLASLCSLQPRILHPMRKQEQ